MERHAVIAFIFKDANTEIALSVIIFPSIMCVPVTLSIHQKPSGLLKACRNVRNAFQICKEFLVQAYN